MDILYRLSAIKLFLSIFKMAYTKYCYYNFVLSYIFCISQKCMSLYCFLNQFQMFEW